MCHTIIQSDRTNKTCTTYYCRPGATNLRRLPSPSVPSTCNDPPSAVQSACMPSRCPTVFPHAQNAQHHTACPLPQIDAISRRPTLLLLSVVIRHSSLLIMYPLLIVHHVSCTSRVCRIVTVPCCRSGMAAVLAANIVIAAYAIVAIKEDGHEGGANRQIVAPLKTD